MYTCIMDAPSPFHVDLPPAAENIVVFSRSENFVEYDLTLPLEKQSPFTPELVELIDEAAPYLREFKSSEARRIIASEELKQLDIQLKSTLDDMSLVIRAKFLKAPSRAEEWGFSIKQATSNVSYPVARRKRLAVLKTYIEKEESRPEAERFAEPSLDSVIQLHNTMKSKIAERDAGERARKRSYVIMMELSRKMLDRLRIAGAFIIARHFDYKITHDLENWGYVVVKRSTRLSKNGEEGVVEEFAPESTPNGSLTNGTVNLNGSAEALLSVDEE